MFADSLLSGHYFWVCITIVSVFSFFGGGGSMLLAGAEATSFWSFLLYWVCPMNFKVQGISTSLLVANLSILKRCGLPVICHKIVPFRLRKSTHIVRETCATITLSSRSIDIGVARESCREAGFPNSCSHISTSPISGLYSYIPYVFVHMKSLHCKIHRAPRVPLPWFLRSRVYGTVDCACVWTLICTQNIFNIQISLKLLSNRFCPTFAG